VRFDVGAGYATATQLVLVPIMLSVPPAAAPLVVALSALVRRIPDCVGPRRVHPLRLVFTLPDAWHAAGPALVLALAGAPAPSAALWPLYLAALAAQLASDVGSGVLREWAALRVRPGLQLRLLLGVVAVDVALAPIGLLVVLGAGSAPWAIVCVLPLAGLLARFARERDERMRQALQLSGAYRGTALLMSDVLEADDAYTGGVPARGVVALALAVGEAMDLTVRQRRDLEFASLLHDVGKLRISKDIINKPGKLNEAEWEVIRRHPADGQAMLERVGGTLAEVGRIVRAHHERMDGAGYPDGLKGEAIPLEARSICACDAYDAMTTTRSYRDAMGVADALAELQRCAGSQFDPDVVAAICRVVGVPAATAREPVLLAA
jgi:HD-GYP domain-containing protein (c-di-GMP phosphodiesterase class II)